MKISLSDAGSQLPELFRRAQDGDEIVLTEGQDEVQLVPVPIVQKPKAEELRAFFKEFLAEHVEPDGGPDAAHSQDYLYDEDGLPR